VASRRDLHADRGADQAARRRASRESDELSSVGKRLTAQRLGRMLSSGNLMTYRPDANGAADTSA
jgi:hypothetical protein